MIARELGVSAMGVKKYLNREGVDTRKRLVEVFCVVCGKPVRRNRARVRTNRRNYCGKQCYYKYRENLNAVRNRTGLRHARKKVGGYIKLEWAHVVHHEDGNELNNELGNLKVFANNSEHMRYHHGDSTVVPVWDGTEHLRRKECSEK